MSRPQRSRRHAKKKKKKRKGVYSFSYKYLETDKGCVLIKCKKKKKNPHYYLISYRFQILLVPNADESDENELPNVVLVTPQREKQVNPFVALSSSCVGV